MLSCASVAISQCKQSYQIELLNPDQPTLVADTHSLGGVQRHHSGKGVNSNVSVVSNVCISPHFQPSIAFLFLLLS